jgi:hypothetical protein
MAPWQPLLQARVLQFIHDLVGIIFSRDALKNRARRAGRAIGNFLMSSYNYVQKQIGFRTGQTKEKPDSKQIRSDPKYAKDTGRKEPEPKRRTAVRRSARQSPFEDDEMKQINDEYLQCVEERSIPVFEGQGLETAQAITKNKSAATICKLNSIKTYTNLMFNRV